jgi:predicted HTH transcriptional regulator
VGALLGVLVALFNRSLFERTQRINRLMAELEKDLNAIIAKGEHNTLEFKSSLRWDLRQDKLNKSLENSVLKTLAGYMNAEGGTLLIGVADDGEVLGLERDYQSLKKKDRDGFEQAIMGAISARIGTDLCTLVQAVFHSMEGRDVCRLIISPAPRPVYVSQDNETRFYLRTGPGTRELNIQEAIEYISSRWS